MKEALTKFKNKTSFLYKKFDLNFKKFINKYLLIIITVLITVLSLTARYMVAMFATNDVAGIIFSWIRDIQNLGIGKFYKTEADYSYFLLFIYAIIFITILIITIFY